MRRIGVSEYIFPTVNSLPILRLILVAALLLKPRFASQWRKENATLVLFSVPLRKSVAHIYQKSVCFKNSWNSPAFYECFKAKIATKNILKMTVAFSIFIQKIFVMAGPFWSLANPSLKNHDFRLSSDIQTLHNIDAMIKIHSDMATFARALVSTDDAYFVWCKKVRPVQNTSIWIINLYVCPTIGRCVIPRYHKLNYVLQYFANSQFQGRRRAGHNNLKTKAFPEIYVLRIKQWIWKITNNEM